ncbi:MAG: WYL domain-containing protein [Oscillospiraceae bacterium]|nr:WYL domain-containing protein [Oscillospiraceae bacterium]
MDHERILYILEYLNRHTNETDEVTIKDILDHLAKNYNLPDVSPLTIRRDLERMMLAGYQIHLRRGPHNTAYYRLESRGFTFNEIRFLVDSVSINQFLSDRQKQQLIKKFEVLCSEDEVRRLISRIRLNGASGGQGNLLENLDKVHQVIANRQKINFEYGKYDVNQCIQYYQKSRNLIPLQVVYMNNRFYLRCADTDQQKLRTYRIDRMKNIVGGEAFTKRIAIPKPEGVILDMFEPEYYESVRLRVKRFLLDDMLEQMGNFASVREDTEPNWVQVAVRIGINGSFFRWVMRYGADVELLAPESLRSQFCEYLQETLQLYQG